MFAIRTKSIKFQISPHNIRTKRFVSNNPNSCVTVQETGKTVYQNEVKTSSHTFFSDEPKSIPGGTDSGPSPYDLLLASLGSCTSLTLRMYANMKKIPLEKIKVELKHERMYPKDCSDCVQQPNQDPNTKIEIIERVITLQGPNLTEENRKRLIEIANKCPVHRTLSSQTKIVTKLD